MSNKVTLEDIENEIQAAYYFTAADGVVGASDFHAPPTHTSLSLLTFCVLVLKNGHTVVGKSACVAPENFNAEIGRKVARQDAVSNVWPLLGFRLADRLHAERNPVHVYRDAGTGQFVSKEDADANPSTTTQERL